MGRKDVCGSQDQNLDLEPYLELHWNSARPCTETTFFLKIDFQFRGFLSYDVSDVNDKPAFVSLVQPVFFSSLWGDPGSAHLGGVLRWALTQSFYKQVGKLGI